MDGEGGRNACLAENHVGILRVDSLQRLISQKQELLRTYSKQILIAHIVIHNGPEV